MIFSEKHIYEKIVCYTGTLTEGRTGLTSPFKIVGLLMLIHMSVIGIPLRSKAFESIQHNSFQDMQQSNFGPSPGGDLGPNWHRFLSIGW